jgi:NAD-dependent dihydropyrimidine dehydrogenase PreA subunit
MSPFQAFALSESSLSLQRAMAELEAKRFFKLILGASYTDLKPIGLLAQLYAEAGCSAIDMACDPAVLKTVVSALDTLSEVTPKPLLMVSLDLDGDPHFRKVEVDVNTCIVCGACLPVCPTQALSLSFQEPAVAELKVQTEACYGCSRCLPPCPVEAFTLVPIAQVPQPIRACLQSPSVRAVELHTQALAVDDLEAWFTKFGDTLKGKLVSLCFRQPQGKDDEHNVQRLLSYFEAFQRLTEQSGVTQRMLQLDGAPMSGSSEKEASLQAVTSAAWFLSHPELSVQAGPLTLSGGINPWTPSLLQERSISGVSGFGVGTVARTQGLSLLEQEPWHEAVENTRRWIASFQV